MASDRETGELVNILLCPMKMLEKEVFFFLRRLVEGILRGRQRRHRGHLSLSWSLSRKGSLLQIVRKKEESGLRKGKEESGEENLNSVASSSVSVSSSSRKRE
jgi:hypothetical protein